MPKNKHELTSAVTETLSLRACTMRERKDMVEATGGGRRVELKTSECVAL